MLLHFSLTASSICNGDTEITSKTDNYLVENTDLELNCESMCRNRFGSQAPGSVNITWRLPNDNIAVKVHIFHFKSEEWDERKFNFQENRAQLIKMDKRSSKLIVTNVTRTKDLGKYQCVNNCVLGDVSATFDIAESSNGSFFKITKSAQFSHFESSTNKPAEMLLVKYQSYPAPVFEWFDNDKRSVNWTIKEDPNKKFEAFRDLNKKWTALKIRNATVSDSGNYTLSVRTGITTKAETFEMLVAGI